MPRYLYQLKSGIYPQPDKSLAFPQVSATQLNKFLVQRQTQSENQVMGALRNSIQELSDQE